MARRSAAMVSGAPDTRSRSQVAAPVALAKVAKQLAGMDHDIEVQGHTDALGDPVYNYDLSRRRAQSVVDALLDLGVPPELLMARGYGPSRPVSDNDTDEGRALNRRVDFRTIVAD